MKLRIVSDGRAGGTHVYTEDGQIIENIFSIEWSVRTGDIATATLKVTLLHADVVGETEQYEILDVTAVGEKRQRKILLCKEKL